MTNVIIRDCFNTKELVGVKLPDMTWFAVPQIANCLGKSGPDAIYKIISRHEELFKGHVATGEELLNHINELEGSGQFVRTPYLVEDLVKLFGHNYHNFCKSLFLDEFGVVKAALKSNTKVANEFTNHVTELVVRIRRGELKVIEVNKNEEIDVSKSEVFANLYAKLLDSIKDPATKTILSHAISERMLKIALPEPVAEKEYSNDEAAKYIGNGATYKEVAVIARILGWVDYNRDTKKYSALNPTRVAIKTTYKIMRKEDQKKNDEINDKIEAIVDRPVNETCDKVVYLGEHTVSILKTAYKALRAYYEKENCKHTFLHFLQNLDIQGYRIDEKSL